MRSVLKYWKLLFKARLKSHYCLIYQIIFCYYQGSGSRKRKVESDDTGDDDDDVAGVALKPPPSRVREGGRQLKAVKYTFDDDNDDDSDDIAGLSDSAPSPHRLKRRKKIESDEEFELSS